jgi:hypothetical protein
LIAVKYYTINGAQCFLALVVAVIGFDFYFAVPLSL